MKIGTSYNIRKKDGKRKKVQKARATRSRGTGGGIEGTMN